MEKLKVTKLEKLAYKISKLLSKNNCSNSVSIFWEGKRLSTIKTSGTWVLDNAKGSDYTEYENDSTIIMTFEGDFYDIINYGSFTETHDKFNKLIEKYGYYFEQGNSWNLLLCEN